MLLGWWGLESGCGAGEELLCGGTGEPVGVLVEVVSCVTFHPTQVYVSAVEQVEAVFG